MNTDKPISCKQDDRFGRAGFATRLAEMIAMPNSESSIVAAIYSEWGNGKSSVLNMVDESLPDSVITVRFNPWRYDDQDQLIINFFNSIVEAVDTSNFKKKDDLKQRFKKYGASAVPLIKMIPLVGGLSGTIVESVSNLIEEKSTEKFRNELIAILVEESKRIVVIIDDIDRLDKDEALNLLKLVKLTGDLPYISYLLAFDKNIISSLISGRYTYSSDSGQKFLEKIVQLPLELPKIRYSDLHNFTHQNINLALKETNANVEVEDYQYFSASFDKDLIDKIRLPRDAIRISNVYRFAIPIIKDEVYIPDIMLLEMIKLFYPSAYEVIEDYPELFVETDKDFNDTLPRYHVPKYDKEELKQKIFASCNSEKERKDLENLLFKIFPLYQQNTSNMMYDQLTRVRWMSGQRIASSKYLNRYLSLSLADGDIPDQVFNAYISLVSSTEDENLISDRLKEIFNTYSLNYVIHRLRSIEADIDVVYGLKIAVAIARNAGQLEEFESIFLSSVGNSAGQSSIFIKTLISRLPESDRIRWCKKIIRSSTDIKFAATFIDFLVMKPRFEEALLKEEDIIDLKFKLLQTILRSIKEGYNIFSEYPRMMQTLVIVWVLRDREGFEEYMNQHVFSKKSRNIFDFIKIFAPVRWSSINPEPYTGNISKEGYRNLKEVVEVDRVVAELNNIFIDEGYTNDVYWLGDYDNNQTDLNLGKQIVFHYNTVNEEE